MVCCIQGNLTLVGGQVTLNKFPEWGVNGGVKEEKGQYKEEDMSRRMFEKGYQEEDVWRRRMLGGGGCEKEDVRRRM